MDADPKIDPSVLCHAGVALDEVALHFNRAAYSVDHAAKLDENSVAGPLDSAPAMGGDGGIDQVAAQPSKTRQRAVLFHPGEPAVTDDVRDQDRSDLARLAHGEPLRSRD